MTRRVYENNYVVWNYSNVMQPSEQNRLYHEYGIGNIKFEVVIPNTNNYVQTLNSKDMYIFDKHYIVNDILALTIDDVSKLKKILNNCKNYYITKELEKIYISETINQDKTINTYLIHKTITNSCKDYYFFKMIECYIDYMKARYIHFQQEEFNFIGNYY